MNPYGLGFRWLRSLGWIVVSHTLLDWMVATREPDGWMFLALSAFVLTLGRCIVLTYQLLNRWSHA